MMQQRKPIYLLVSLALLSGCSTLKTKDPYTGLEKFSSTAKGCALGFVSGGGSGAAIGAAAGRGNRGKSSAIGAAIGAVVGLASGCGYGYYLDRQEEELRLKLEGTGVKIKRNRSDLELIMPGDILFDIDGKDVSADFYPVLDSISIVLKEYDETTVYVSGHTDNTGGLEYNLNLSQQRADSVAKFLATAGVGRQRLRPRGYYYSNPIASNSNKAGRSKNRRVEIIISQ